MIGPIKNTVTDLKTIKVGPKPIDLSCIPPEFRTRFFNPGELEILISILKQYGVKSMLEIGCQNGRTAKAILHNIPEIESYYGIDVPLGYVPECDVQKNETPANPGQLALDDERFTLLLNKKGSAAPALQIDITDSKIRVIDAIFIDGDHSYTSVMNDHSNACRLNPAIIIHHDYHDLGTVGVKEAIHYLDRNMKADSSYEFCYIQQTWFVLYKPKNYDPT